MLVDRFNYLSIARFCMFHPRVSLPEQRGRDIYGRVLKLTALRDQWWAGTIRDYFPTNSVFRGLYCRGTDLNPNYLAMVF